MHLIHAISSFWQEFFLLFSLIRYKILWCKYWAKEYFLITFQSTQINLFYSASSIVHVCLNLSYGTEIRPAATINQ